MSLMEKVMTTVIQFVPDKEPDPLIGTGGYIGKPLTRVDGTLKVTGAAPFAAEHQVEGLVHAVVVHSTIAKGRAVMIDTALASAATGVLAIITHENAPRMERPSLLNLTKIGDGVSGSELPILQSDVISYDGEPLALVVAETLEQAEHAASLVSIEYEVEQPDTSFDGLKRDAETPSKVLGEDPELKKGDAEKAVREAEFSVDAIYRTPRVNHNALELHATIAQWEDDEHLTVFDSSQYVNGFKHQLAKIFGLRPDDVRVISPFVGGGFGGKWAMWANSALCVAAAKVTKRPVKLVLSREGVFRIIGGRTLSEQRVALACDPNGKFLALVHTGVTATTTHAKYPEQFSLTPRHLYRAEAFDIGQKIVNLNTVANTWMRAPGEGIATFALECAIDELAHNMKMDPIELRRLNEPEKDPTKDIEFSMRNLVEAYRRGAERFGWHNRSLEPGSQRDGKWWVGQGVATAYYPYFRYPAKIRLRMSPDGSVQIKAAGAEMGMGTATVQLQHAAQRLGLPIEKISFEYGDSSLPDSPVMAGGSSQTVTIAAAVQANVEKLLKELIDEAGSASPLHRAKLDEVEARDEGIFRLDGKGGETYVSLLEQRGQGAIELEESSGMPLEMMKYSMASYGAQFCEVRVHKDTGETRISRWLGSFDCGRILNPKTALSQFRGAIVMGIGMALEEETLFDERRGRIVSRSLADYHVPVNLDIPEIDVIYNDIPDEHTALGARGLGEIGLTGAAAAVANAVFNATGKRIRELPITLDKLL